MLLASSGDTFLDEDEEKDAYRAVCVMLR